MYVFNKSYLGFFSAVYATNHFLFSGFFDVCLNHGFFIDMIHQKVSFEFWDKEFCVGIVGVYE